MAMSGEKKKRLTPLEIRCITKFYLLDSGVINQCSSPYFKSLGVEKGLEVIMKLAQEEPITIKVKAKNEHDFIIYFDEEADGKFEEIFIMENGVKVL